MDEQIDRWTPYSEMGREKEAEWRTPSQIQANVRTYDFIQLSLPKRWKLPRCVLSLPGL